MLLTARSRTAGWYSRRRLLQFPLWPAVSTISSTPCAISTRAAELYRRLGFTVGARNRHPWGTHNYIIQLPGFFIELLTLAEPDKLGADGFSRLFAAYTRDFLTRGEGLALLILQSRDASADEAAFRAAKIAGSEVMRFEREGKRPDGTAVKVGFSLAFADDKLAPDIHFATCQQHYPENFWNPAFQKHANSVSGIAGVVAVAEEPERHRNFMQAFAGADGDAQQGRFQHCDAARHHRGHDAGRLPPSLWRGGAGRVARRAAGGDALYGRRCEPAAGRAGTRRDGRPLCRKCRRDRPAGRHGRSAGIRTGLRRIAR